MQVDEAYRHCRAVTFKHAKTFFFASVFLPEQKRNACYAVYAFCRYVDDLIDQTAAGDVGRGDVERVIELWRRELDRVYAGERVVNPVMCAWHDTLARYEIPRELVDELIAGVMSDLRPVVRYGTFEELERYCYRVASVVGLMTSEIFGYDDPRARGYAIDLGTAMQLTNILRDVGEDLTNGRVYLPADELRAHGLDLFDLARGEVSDHFRSFMREQIARAHSYYDRADSGIALLERDSRLTVSLMSYNYRRILDRIEENDYDVFSRRAAVPLHRKLMTVPTLWYATRHAVTATPERA